MRLNDLEKIILVAEKDYRTTESKLNYVNLKMGFIKINSDREITIRPNCKNKLIQDRTYYRKVGELQTKTKVRANQIMRGMLTELVNEHDTLIEDRKEVRDMMASAMTSEKHMAAARLKITQVELGQRIFAVKQNIATLMERQPVESQEDTIEEQIRLFTKIH